MIVLYILGLSILSGILYRIGGSGWFKNCKAVRRFGCALLGIIALILLGIKVSIYAYVLTFALSAMALSTYNDWLNNGDENWLCWLVTGALYGLAFIPIALGSGCWIGLIIRSIVLSFGVMLVRELTSKVFVEEFGSGFLFIATIPLLLI